VEFLSLEQEEKMVNNKNTDRNRAEIFKIGDNRIFMIAMLSITDGFKKRKPL